MAETFLANYRACRGESGPAWRASTPNDALAMARYVPNYIALDRRSFECVTEVAPKEYAQFNEADRDKFQLKKALEFILQHPKTFAELTYNKFVGFYLTGWAKTGLVAVVALAGALFTLGNQNGRILTMLAISYAVPYCLSVPIYHRYRYPIDPLLFVLASSVLLLLASKSLTWLEKLIKRYPYRDIISQFAPVIQERLVHLFDCVSPLSQKVARPTGGITIATKRKLKICL